ncbi:NmrA family NAD(P)-binding protein [Streptomyces sp. NPDC047022]|uniref:NmrA family NAD(P)-binding protein n=1 Tax=Streptomyces sp. NPDC047022 TaxID=3155737 RepID=UPI0033C83DFE
MLTVAVTGATGAQGGATARALLAAGHRVRALTRRTDSPAADALRGLGAEVCRADFDDRPSLEAALAGADSLFAVTTPFGAGAGTGTEVRQGESLVDAAAEVHVGHVVYTSAAHADRDTGVPHYESKRAVERHLRAAGVPWTVIGPAAFMDNFATGWTLDGPTTAGLDVDAAGLRRDHPDVGWHSFTDWAAAQDWPALLVGKPARH